jgi:hypothetical protein
MNHIARTSAAIAVLLAANAFAGSTEGPTMVTSVGINGSGNAIIQVATVNHTETCGRPAGQKSLTISKDNPKFNAMYATVLAAKSTGSPILAWVQGCIDFWGDGSNVVPQITDVGVQ